MREIVHVDGTSLYEGCISHEKKGYYCGLHDTPAKCRRAEERMKRELLSGKRKLKKKVVKPDPTFNPQVQELLGRRWE